MKKNLVKAVMPKLYKKNVSGKIEIWFIEYFFDEARAGGIKITYGKLDGKMQTKIEEVKTGKNLGKKNETTIGEQTRAEAYARWKKQLKKGYVKTIAEAEANKTDEIIQGGIIPMLAHKFEDHKKKLTFPVYVQPKLDGERCIAIKQNGTITLWTRTRKPITSCPHIISQLESVFPLKQDNMFFDGELYVHGKDNFEKIMSAVRKQKPSEESALIEYHIYDCENLGDKTQPFHSRLNVMRECLDILPNVKFVETFMSNNEQNIEGYQQRFIQEGYEGLMVRGTNSVYECKRSKNLLKMKTFDDAEFRILDVEAGEDNSVVFTCITNRGDKFKATKSGDKKENQKYLIGKKKWFGKLLTVKYQGLTGKNNVPRFPVALRIREQ